MNADFRILREETVYYKKKDLCVMLLIDSGNYAVEVVSATDSYGRKFCKDRTQADKVFDFLNEKLSLIGDYDKAVSLLETCRKVSLIEMKLLFLVTGKKFGQADIGKLITDFQLTIKSRIKPSKEMIIRIYLYKSKKCYGKFTGTFLKKDFIFEKT